MSDKLYNATLTQKHNEKKIKEYTKEQEAHPEGSKEHSRKQADITDAQNKLEEANKTTEEVNTDFQQKDARVEQSRREKEEAERAAAREEEEEKQQKGGKVKKVVSKIVKPFKK